MTIIDFQALPNGQRKNTIWIEKSTSLAQTNNFDTEDNISSTESIINLFTDRPSKEHGIHTFKFTEDDIVRSQLVKFIITKLKSLSK